MDVNEFKTLLTARELQLVRLNKQAEAGIAPVELDQTSVGRLSRMDAMQAQAMNQEAQRRRVQELLEIKAAFKRLKADEYGDCAKCGEPIALARLRINPVVLYCISCAD